MIKVAVVVSNFPSLSQTFVALQIAELKKRGCEVIIYNLGEIGSLDWLPESVRPVFDQIRIVNFQEIEDVGVKERALVFSKYPLAYMRIKGLRATKSISRRQMKRMIKLSYFCRDMEDFDILHCQFVNHLGRFLDIRHYGLFPSKLKIVASVRGYDITRKSTVEKIDMDRLFAQTSLFLPVCTFLEDVLKSKGCDKPIKVVPSPINVDTFSYRGADWASGQDKLCFVSVGRLVEKKGFDVAIKALSELKREGLDFCYQIIGDGDQREMLEQLIADQGVENEVELLGGMPSDQTVQLFSAADFFLAPSRVAEDGNSEGIPNVIKEAMCIGVPVVASKHAGIPELVIDRETGFLSEENDADSFRCAIQDAMGSRGLWPVIIANAREKVQSGFTVSVSTSCLLDAYNFIVSNEQNHAGNLEL